MKERILICSSAVIVICYIAAMLYMIAYTPPQGTSQHEQPMLSNPVPIAIVMDVPEEQCYTKYNSFMDVPAGQVDNIIMIADILYKQGEHAWIPIYSDEDVAWVTGDGDTIYE